METQISAKLSHLDGILGGRDFGYEEFDADETIGHTVREALARVAAFSDNYAAILLAEKVGWDSIQQMADGVGATKTSIKNPIITSAEDVGLILEKLYKGEVVSLESSEQILDLLSKSQMNNRIPAKLPQDIRIAHKTGELSGVRNDAGIVFLDGNPYVIVEMSQNLTGEDEGVENLAEISKIVYDYYASNQK
jgi:beta-lactamase class A